MSTESPVPMWSWSDGIVDEVLLASGRKLADHVCLLDSHNRDRSADVLGHFEDIATEGTDTVGSAVFDLEDDNAATIYRKYKNKHARDFSVGYQVHSALTIEPGESATYEGRTFTAGVRQLRVATDWTITECSATPIGADKRAKSRSQVDPSEIEALEAERKKHGVTTVVARPVTQPGLSGNNERQVAMSNKTESPEVQAPVDTEALIRQGIERESKRRADIKAIADGVRAEVLDKCLDDPSCDIDKARSAFLVDMQEQRKQNKPVEVDAPYVSTGSAKVQNARSLALAIAQSIDSNVDPKALARCQYDQQTGRMKFRKSASEETRKEIERDYERAEMLSGASQVDLCRQLLALNKIEPGYTSEDIAIRAFSAPAVGAIYSNALGAILVSSMGDMIDSTEGWVADVESVNYMKNPLLRLDAGRLPRRDRGKEASTLPFADNAEDLQLFDHAGLVTIDQQNIVTMPPSLESSPRWYRCTVAKRQGRSRIQRSDEQRKPERRSAVCSRLLTKT